MKIGLVSPYVYPLPGGVTEVEHRLVGKLVQHRPGHGETTEA